MRSFRHSFDLDFFGVDIAPPRSARSGVHAGREVESTLVWSGACVVPIAIAIAEPCVGDGGTGLVKGRLARYTIPHHHRIVFRRWEPHSQRRIFCSAGPFAACRRQRSGAGHRCNCVFWSRPCIQARTSLSSQPTRLRVRRCGRGNRPARYSRQIVVSLRPVVETTSHFGIKRSDALV